MRSSYSGSIRWTRRGRTPFSPTGLPSWNKLFGEFPFVFFFLLISARVIDPIDVTVRFFGCHREEGASTVWFVSSPSVSLASRFVSVFFLRAFGSSQASRQQGESDYRVLPGFFCFSLLSSRRCGCASFRTFQRTFQTIDGLFQTRCVTRNFPPYFHFSFRRSLWALLGLNVNGAYWVLPSFFSRLPCNLIRSG